MGNDPREWVAVRTSGWWCEEPGLWDTPLRCVSLQPPATPSIVYAWDHRNRLIGVTEFDDEENILSEVKHEYDLFNRWIHRSVDPDGPGGAPAVDTYFSWFEGQLTLQFDGTTASDLGQRYFWNPAAVDQILAAEEVTSLASPGEVIYPLTDHLGTTRDLAEYDAVEEETTIASHRVFDSFGVLISETSSSTTNLIGFTGRPLDESTGLQNNWNRWYDAEAGRWPSEDPIGFGGQDPNLARYVGNSPVQYVDPSGLERWYLPWERGASIHPGRTISFWLRHSPAAHLRGLYTGETDETPHTGACMEAAGQAYTAHLGNAYAILRITDQVDPSGLVASSTLGGLQYLAGDELNAIAAQNVNVYLDLADQGSQKVGQFNLMRRIWKSVGNRIGSVDHVLRCEAPKGPKFTEPTLPNKKIVDEGGVRIEHYTRGNDHPPAHAHVYGEGRPTRIGANGKPLKGDPDLSPQQQTVVDNNISTIRSTINKIKSWWKWKNHLEGQ